MRLHGVVLRHRDNFNVRTARLVSHSSSLYTPGETNEV